MRFIWPSKRELALERKIGELEKSIKEFLYASNHLSNMCGTWYDCQSILNAWTEMLNSDKEAKRKRDEIEVVVREMLKKRENKGII